MIKRMSHLGLAVKNIGEVASLFSSMFGLTPSKILDVPEHGFKSVMFQIGDNFIELLEGTGPETEMGKFVERNGEGLYHVCVVVDDIDAQISSLKAKGVEVLELPPTPNFPFKRGMMTRKATRGVRLELVTEEGIQNLLKEMFG